MGKGKGKDIYQRVNFLYQAAYTVLAMTPTNFNLIRYYGRTIKMICQKSQIKLDPDIKRTMCKKCYIILYPGITSTFRLKSKRSKHSIIKCLTCGTIKRFLNKADYELWYNRPEAQVSIEYLGNHIEK
ncbi:ribonuclease P protein subunit p21 [Centruroides vittatus]|uniref:ribonuclease P protein subunit p21 n=1 Tax=Centruroides vittatus TaxID=120091 RepID=UPI00350EADB2